MRVKICPDRRIVFITASLVLWMGFLLCLLKNIITSHIAWQLLVWLHK